MEHAWIILVATVVILFSTGQVSAQYEYGPEEEGAEPSPIVDPDTDPDEAETPEERRKERGCAVDRSSTPSEAPVEALLFGLGLIAFRRLRANR